ncbi:MAG: DNA cytosine methyltransferase [Flavobacteriales bacterium]
MNKSLTYISLFSSAGIGCFGFKQHGFECIATNELLEKRLKIQLYNNKCKYKSGYISGSIVEDEIRDKLYKELNLWKDKHAVKSPDVIIATPPCQGMSIANHKKSNELIRNSLVVESIRLTKAILPKFFVFENVRAFLKTDCTDLDGKNKPIGEAINLNLAGNYNILSKIINLKDFGSNSSRTRTLVIGVRKDIQNISPYNIFPKMTEPKTLRKLFNGLPYLNFMGEISTDIYHSYRKFDKRMLPWIENTQEGESAFENKDPKRIPHRIIDGRMVFNKSKNGDKYARWFWDREGPCIHTRNDILASQNTIHPSENRVFSIRELMKMMSIPDTFKWSNLSDKNLNRLTDIEKTEFLKKNELNIRHCIGEAVPTAVLKSIAENIKYYSNKANNKSLPLSKVTKLIKDFNLQKPDKLIEFIKLNFSKFSLDTIFLIAEHSNSERQQTSAYFTRKDIAYSVVKDLPELKSKKCITILEPSVGIGNFIPLLFDKYKDNKKVELDVCDIDDNSIKILKVILSEIGIPDNFTIKFHHVDFLLWDIKKRYDIIVGNPPYKKVVNNKSLLAIYKKNLYNSKTNNIFSFFIEKSLDMANSISLIVPKSLLNSPEFNNTRTLLIHSNLTKICDYGEKAFKGVKIETISFLCSKTDKLTDNIIIESYIRNIYKYKSKSYIFSTEFPYWLIYRDKFFDSIVDKMDLGVFDSFRDRQITKKITLSKGKIKVLKSRNIDSNKIKKLNGYDCFIDNIDNLVVSKYYNKSNIVMIPNLTYYPRACFLPKESIVDGSVALLTIKNGNRKPSKIDLDFYSSKDFESYYRVARNYGTRSLNIDNNSVFFFGLLKNLK